MKDNIVQFPVKPSKQEADLNQTLSHLENIIKCIEDSGVQYHSCLEKRYYMFILTLLLVFANILSLFEIFLSYAYAPLVLFILTAVCIASYCMIARRIHIITQCVRQYRHLYMTIVKATPMSDSMQDFLKTRINNTINVCFDS